MEKLLHLPTFFLFPLFLTLLLPVPLVSSADTQYFISCGSANDIALPDGRKFVGDLNSNANSFSVTEGTAITIENPSSQNTSQLYQTARLFRNPSKYDFNITSNGTYLVRLHFFPFTSKGTNLFNSYFTVSTLNFTLQNSNSTNFPGIQEFYINLSFNVSNFSIYFVPSGEHTFAFVNAIEVVVLPTGFFQNEAIAVPPVEDKDGFYHGLLSDGLRKVYGVNVYGPEVNGSYWRNWKPDDGYLLISSGSNNKSYDGNLIQVDPSVAPDSVYKTFRYLNSTDPTTRITWRFRVAMNTRHLVRAHFCDLLSISLSFGSFNFYVYGNYNISIVPSDNTTSPATPFYYDYVVYSDSSGYLNISIGSVESSDVKLAYLNGVEVMEFVTRGNLDLKLFDMKSRGQKFPNVIVGSVVGSAVVVSLLVFLLVWKLRKSGRLTKADTWKDELPDGRGRLQSWYTERIDSVSPIPNLNLKLKIAFGEILAATQNFNANLLIGEGGFGKVYKGTLSDGTKVAVKRSDSSHGQGLPEFRTEVLVLSKIRHRHLVSLIGYCDEGSEMILVYEFMEKGTLREHLYNYKENSKGAERKSELDWKQRLEICIGSAIGLHYLHTGSDGGIIHRDVKSTNILLDEHLVAKVADFGLSQSGPPDPDHSSTAVKGSFGYLDPEYFRTFQLTNKSDVYSFGVVLLEVLCARPPIVDSAQREEISLAEWGLHWLKKGELEKIIDPSLTGQINPNSLRKFGEIAEKCLCLEGADRPSMYDIRWDLEYALQLQKTAVPREPHEYSTSDASSNLLLPAAQGLSIISINEEDDSPFFTNDGDSETTASGVFSQLNIVGGR